MDMSYIAQYIHIFDYYGHLCLGQTSEAGNTPFEICEDSERSA